MSANSVTKLGTFSNNPSSFWWTIVDTTIAKQWKSNSCPPRHLVLLLAPKTGFYNRLLWLNRASPFYLRNLFLYVGASTCVFQDKSMNLMWMGRNTTYNNTAFCCFPFLAIPWTSRVKNWQWRALITHLSASLYHRNTIRYTSFNKER